MVTWGRCRGLAALLALGAAGLARAQATTGTLSGEVLDAVAGKPLAGVQVSATSPALDGPRTVVTDVTGRFVLGALPPAIYRLEALAEGYLPEARAELAVKPNTTLQAGLVLTPEAVHLEEVVVTGSHIQRKDLVSPAPLTIITREQLLLSGKLQVGDYLQALPEQANAMNANYNNAGDGSIRASLRGLGANRTLVLLNGRRYVAGGMGANDSVDLGGLPSAAVERIEILKDGASPIYGSEAIGGVINVITRRAWAGTEATAYTGTSGHGDGASYDFNVTTGQVGDKGSVLLSIGYGVSQPAWADKRGWSQAYYRYDPWGRNNPTGQAGPYATGSGYTPNGKFYAVNGPGRPVDNPTNDPKIGLYNQLVASYPTAPWFTPDPSAPLGWRAWAGDALPQYGGDQYNTLPETYLVIPYQRFSVFGTGDVKLGSHSRAFLELTYVNRQSQQNLAPEPLDLLSDGIVISADNHYNPFGVDLREASGRLSGLGDRTWTQNVDSLRVLAGFDGALPDAAGPLEGWRWELSGNFGRTLATESSTGLARRSALKNALGPSQNYGSDAAPDWGCVGGDGKRVRGCVPINIFGAGGALTPEQAASVTYDGTSRGTNQLVGGLATVSGELFRLWAERPAGLAFGFEYRKVSGTQVPDAMIASGEAATTGTTYKTSGWQDVREAFLELSLPFLEGAPLAEVLEVQLAARGFRYSGFGADSTWKVGARWKPLRDVTFRGTASTAFRAPSIQELYYGTNSYSDTATDPCAGVDSLGRPAPISPWCGDAAFNGDPRPFPTWQDQGNPALRPETARVFTAGVVLEPRFLPGFSAALDAYGVAIDNVIQYSGVNPINSCYPTQAGLTPLYCDQVRRDPVTHRLTNILQTPINVGSERMAGLDLALRYRIPTGLGRFDLAWDGTWLQKYDIVLGNGTTLHTRGNFDLPRGVGSANPALRFNASAGWRRDGLGGAVDVRYLSALKECAVWPYDIGAYCSRPHDVERRVSEHYAWNAQAGYGFDNPAGRTEVQVGVQNLLDTPPPRVYSAYLPSDPGYDFMGRFFYLRLSHRL
jgi:outer membrane receptor protein involved in Fe transport